MGVEYMWCLYRVCVCVLCVCLFAGECTVDSVDTNAMSRTEGEQDNVTSVCDMRGCNCTPASHKYWLVVNCTFDNRQVVDFKAGFLPSNTLELSVIGGGELRLHTQVFTGLGNLQLLRFDGTRTVVVRRGACYNPDITSLMVQISGCDRLVLESEAFTTAKGPVIVEVSRCGYVALQKSVFSFLQSGTFQEIPRLELAEGAFILQARTVGSQGPVTTIRFRSVMIPTLSKDVFKSTLAEVSFLDSEVRSVMSEAFSGNTIAAVIMTNSSLHHVHPAAFSERTQLYELQISWCRVHVLYPEAFMSASTNLTIQHSKITTIYSGAINATVAQVAILNNDIGTVHAKAFAVHDWSRINIENNIFDQIHENGLQVPFKAPPYPDQCEFTFTGNEITALETGSLRFITNVMPSVANSRFDNNVFRYTCHCHIDGWLQDIFGGKCPSFVNTNFCMVDALLAGCHEIPVGLTNMKNFTDSVCSGGKDVINCKTYAVDANVVNNELSGDEVKNNNDLILGLVLGLVLLIAVSGTVVILLIHGGLWLKRKGYCVRFNNFHQYRVEEESTEAEDIMVNIDKVPEAQIPEELSQELLQALREKLEDPLTYNEAREMIERLYDHFIIEDSYTNNNRQEEETHLYEELGNLTQPHPEQDKTPTRPFSFLRLIEERFNLVPPEQQINKSVLVGEYSEPTDAEVHLYSELPQNKEGKQNEINEGLTQMAETSTQRSNGSGKMAYRPLPDKPRTGNDPGEGPSTKF